jgi:two-component system OmpR family sensor kinase
MTLRARLLGGLLVLTALGLGIAGALTYREIRNYLVDRVDDQLADAVLAPQLFFDRAFFEGQQFEGPKTLPPGTWAQLRSLDGRVITTNSGALPGLAPPRPPEEIVSGEVESLRSPHYRMLQGEEGGILYTDARGAARATLIVAIPMQDVDDTLQRLLVVEAIVAGVVLAAIAGLAWWVVKLGLRPLEQMGDTAGAIAAGDLSRRVEPADDHTEVGRLGVALNEMLVQIERAFDERARSEERLRRFVGDASHELRTPLTSIRGYAELFRRGAAQRPDDLEKTMRRIEEEASRMGVLVDDLLLLARLDQGRPLERAPVDLARLAVDAVDDARAVAPERTIEYTPNGAVVVPGDEARLRQILANLLSNACTHTPPDTPIEVRVTDADAEAVIEVHDEGPGIAPEDAAHIFDRFWRADPSRARIRGGAGLGLSIVAAIADAHGGRAEVESTPGQGATFRVRLPREREQQPDAAAPLAPTAP